MHMHRDTHLVRMRSHILQNTPIIGLNVNNFYVSLSLSLLFYNEHSVDRIGGSEYTDSTPPLLRLRCRVLIIK